MLIFRVRGLGLKSYGVDIPNLSRVGVWGVGADIQQEFGRKICVGYGCRPQFQILSDSTHPCLCFLCGTDVSVYAFYGPLYVRITKDYETFDASNLKRCFDAAVTFENHAKLAKSAKLAIRGGCCFMDIGELKRRRR